MFWVSNFGSSESILSIGREFICHALLKLTFNFTNSYFTISDYLKSIIGALKKVH